MTGIVIQQCGGPVALMLLALGIMAWVCFREHQEQPRERRDTSTVQVAPQQPAVSYGTVLLAVVVLVFLGTLLVVLRGML